MTSELALALDALEELCRRVHASVSTRDGDQLAAHALAHLRSETLAAPADIGRRPK